MGRSVANVFSLINLATYLVGEPDLGGVGARVCVLF